MADLSVDAVRIELDRDELGVAWRRSGLPALPAVLAARDHARVPEDGSVSRLRARGLLDAQGEPSPELRLLLDSLSSAPFEIDLRFPRPDGFGLRAAATVRRGVVSFGMITGERVVLRQLPGTWADDAAGVALVGLLPRVRPARGVRVSLPAVEVYRAITDAMDDDRDACAGLAEGLVARGVARVDAELFAAMVSGVPIRLAVFGVTVRDQRGIRRRASRSVRVRDSDRGRAVMYNKGDNLFAAPADDRTLARALAELRDSERDRV